MVSQRISKGIGKKLIECLNWHFVWGNDVGFLEKRAAAGKSTPALENRPELYSDLQDVWNNFWQLHQSRQYGFGPCPLAVIDIVTYLELYSETDRIERYELIVAMDQEWLKWATSKTEKDN